MEEASKRAEPITYEEVFSVCSLLSDLKVEITQVKIHSILQRGSFTTIAKYIKQWREEQSRSPVKLKRTIIRSIEAEIERASSVITEKAINSASEAVSKLEKSEAARKRLEETIKKLDREIGEQKEAHGKEIEKLQNQIEAEELERSSLGSKLEKQTREYIKMHAHSATIEAETKELQKNEKKLKEELNSIRKEKEALLVENGGFQAIIKELRSQLQEKEE